MKIQCSYSLATSTTRQAKQTTADAEPKKKVETNFNLWTDRKEKKNSISLHTHYKIKAQTTNSMKNPMLKKPSPNSKSCAQPNTEMQTQVTTQIPTTSQPKRSN